MHCVGSWGSHFERTSTPALIVEGLLTPLGFTQRRASALGQLLEVTTLCETASPGCSTRLESPLKSRPPPLGNQTGDRQIFYSLRGKQFE